MSGSAPSDASDEAAAPATEPINLPEIMASLPTETRCPPYLMRQYRGFWLPEFLLHGVAAAHASFEPRPTDVFLASLPKSGTTWLKALAFATLNRAAHPPSGADHPLRRRNPHDCVGSLELLHMPVVDDGAGALPRRLFALHMPYSLLPDRITEESAGCRLVYVARDPKDVLVSFWLFNVKTAATLQKVAGDMRSPLPSFEAAFELFCEGRCVAGPHWSHVLEYWEESRRRPEHVLFLRYEEMLRDPAGNLRKLAAFMGCAFSEEEEEAGVVREIVELCSMEELKSLEVNRNGSTVLGLKNEAFFRKGVAGDWSNYMTPEMAARLDGIVDEALQGSGLTFVQEFVETTPCN